MKFCSGVGQANDLNKKIGVRSGQLTHIEKLKRLRRKIDRITKNLVLSKDQT
jgi:hypothetical protein